MAIGPPLKYIYIYIYIYLARPIATFMNAAIDLPYSRVLETRLKPLINVAIGLLIAAFQKRSYRLCQ